MNAASRVTERFPRVCLVPSAAGRVHLVHVLVCGKNQYARIDAHKAIAETITRGVVVDPPPVSYTHLTLPTIYSV